jgi:3-oxoacyl-[acyl-carrier protein] reductase
VIRFSGKNVIVTGASRGLGRAVAVAFAEEGARVGIGFRRGEAEARKTLHAIESLGGSGVLLPFDVRDRKGVEASFALFAAGERIDVLVNNAATLRDEFAVFLPSAEWDEIVATNLNGTFYCCQAAIKYMLPQRSGAIVNVSSIAGIRASPGQANYAASKGGVSALTVTLAAELAPRGVRVNSVVPGMLNVGMGRRVDRRTADRIRERLPLGRLGEAEEVARAILFLASEDASYVIGHSLVVDGGLSL